MADEAGAQSPDQPAQDEEEYLQTGKLPMEEHMKALNCHQEMHYYLIYARRQILVVYQLFFGRWQTSKMMDRKDYVTPINDHGNQLDIFYSEHLTDYDWHEGLTKGWGHIRRRIADDLNIEQDQVANLPARQLQAKYLEVAITGWDNLDERVAERMQSIDSYINKCRKLVSLLEEGEDRDIKMAALDIWIDKLNQLTARVKSVSGWRNQLLGFAATLISEPTTEIDKEEVGRILGRIYDRLYPAPNRVPVVDFANVAMKISGWDWRGQPKDESGNILWFPPPRHIVTILGELGVLTRRLEAIERGEDTELVPREPKWIKPIDTNFELNSDAFQCLQDLHKELIWGRRQILIVFQLIFGDFVPYRDIDQQLFVGPYEDDGSKFNIEQRENIDPQEWYNAVQFALNYVTKAIKYEQQTNPDSITSDEQRNAKYLELGAEGLKHIVQLTTEGLQKIQVYLAECKKVLKKDSDRKDKQDKVNKFSQEFLDCSAQLQKLIELREKLLEMADNLLDEPWTFTFEMLRNNLSGIYFLIYPIPDQLPMKEFVDIAYTVFGWNWTIELLPDESGQLTLFQTPKPDVQIRGNLGILTEMRRQRESGGAPGFGGPPSPPPGGGPESPEDSGEPGGGGPPSPPQRGEAPEASGGEAPEAAGGVEPPVYSDRQTFAAEQMRIFKYLRRMNNELIYGRRQILFVIQKFFYFQQKKSIWPIQDNEEEFDLDAKENVTLNYWNVGMSDNWKYFKQMLSEERRQAKPGQEPAPQLTNDYQYQAKFLELAVIGLDYLVGLKDQWNEVFNSYLTVVQEKVWALEVSSQERKLQQEALDTFVGLINELKANVQEVHDHWRNRLLEMAVKIFEQSEAVDPNEVLRVLSRVYFQLYPLAEQVPMTQFRFIAWYIQQWHFKMFQRQDQSGQPTWFELPRNALRILGKLGVLWDRIRERRAQGWGGAQG